MCLISKIMHRWYLQAFLFFYKTFGNLWGPGLIPSGVCFPWQLLFFPVSVRVCQKWNYIFTQWVQCKYKCKYKDELYLLHFCSRGRGTSRRCPGPRRSPRWSGQTQSGCPSSLFGSFHPSSLARPELLRSTTERGDTGEVNSWDHRSTSCQISKHLQDKFLQIPASFPVISLIIDYKWTTNAALIIAATNRLLCSYFTKSESVLGCM